MSKILIHEFGKLRIDKEGNWYHNDIPFVHEGISKLFHKSILKISENNYVLKIGENQVPVEFEGAFIWAFDIESDINNSELKLVLSNGNIETVGNENRFVLKDDEFYCYLKDGKKCNFIRRTYNFLLPFMNENSSGYYIQIGNLHIPIYCE